MNLRLRLAMIFLGCITCSFVFAQAPALLNYQGVARNSYGAVIPSKTITLRLSIRSGSATGTIEYSETRTTTTNPFGLFTVLIGSPGAAPTTGTLASVNWGASAKYIQVEIDPNGGNSFINVGTTQLASVPYALNAGTSTPTGSAGGDLGGNYPSPSINNLAVTTGKIADAAIATAKLADNSVTAVKIADNAVTTGKISDNAIITAKLADNSITNAKLQDNSVTTTKLTDNSVVTAKINDAAVANAKIADNAVTVGKLADNSVANAKLQDNSVTAIKIADNSVMTVKINDAAVTNAKIADNAVTDTKLADASVTTNKIADNAITAPKVQAGQLVKSFNGLKDDIVLQATGTASLSVAGNTVTINGTGGGDITGVTAGAGLSGGGTTGAIILSTAFGGSGAQNLSARSDHHHVGQIWTANTGNVLTTYANDVNSIGLNNYSYATGYNGAAVSGQVLSTTGQSLGIFGSTSSDNAYAAGVFGQAVRAGGAKAVWGYGLGSGTFGIYGEGAGINSYAGYFQGRVHVNGQLSKAAGSFKIDHPLDPMNKYLSHSFVESPDMMNVYNGNITLDAKGEATITMPNWFEALNRDFRYQLTSIGKPSPNVYISQEISDNTFRIAGGTPGGKISWMVTGIRQDEYANKHRIPVEEMKPAEERGKLLNSDNTNQRANIRGVNPEAAKE